MIHTIHTMTLSRFVEKEQTGNEALLKRWYNPFPVRWFDTTDFYQNFNNLFGNGNTITESIDKYYLYNKIRILDTCYNMLAIGMKDYNQRALFGLIFKRKVNDSVDMKFYQEKVKAYTGIDVKDFDGLTRLKNELQRLIDKYKERFGDGEPEVESDIEFMDIITNVFRILDTPVNMSLSLYQFSNLKKHAEKLANKQAA